jgi:hypothetical protein
LPEKRSNAIIVWVVEEKYRVSYML